MKSYPSIPTTFPGNGIKIFAFDKLDGSNIRAEWTRKNGFNKFGTRNRLLDERDPIFGEAKPLILEKYSEDLNRIFTDQRWDKAVAFFEFCGPNSFAGNHEDEDHDVVMFDVDVYKKGLLEPQEFLKIFENNVDIAQLLYHGSINSELMDKVKQGTLEGMTFEGVVCKWQENKRTRMCKIKSRLWLNKLKDYCNNDPRLFNVLK